MSVIFKASADGRITGPGFEARCALGKAGVVAAEDKQEGDNASPAGTWPIRRVFYRPDKGGPPETSLPRVPLKRDDCWCDDPAHPLYNRPVSRPFAASHERLWREDSVYDLIVELGYNDDPPVAGKGSAIFMHVAKPDYSGTEGCVALSEPDLRALLKKCGDGAKVEICR